MREVSNILISAYACEPGKGSEPGIGWNWVVTLNKLGYNVTVVTRSNNRLSIEKAISIDRSLLNISFLYYDLPPLLVKAKKIIGVYVYYELWQIGLLSFLRTKVNIGEFDLVHHITFGVYRQPSYLYKLNVPFIFGPLGGGEKIPENLVNSFSPTDRVREVVRNTFNAISLKRTSLLNCFDGSKFVYTRTKDTLSILPVHIQKKAKVFVDIGVYESEICACSRQVSHGQLIRVLYVGRLIYWKGVELAIRAFHAYNKDYPNSIFTIVGSGPNKKDFVKLSIELGLQDKVIFEGAISHAEVMEKYEQSDVFLFPTLHDAGPLVTLEALRHGLPIVTLNIGGIGQLLPVSYPTMVTSQSFMYEETLDKLSELLFVLSTNVPYYQECSKKSLSIARDNTWVNTISNVYDDILNKQQKMVI